MNVLVGLVLVAAFAALVTALVKRHSNADAAEHRSAAFDAAIAADSSSISKALVNASRPLAGVDYITRASESDTYRVLRERLGATGMYGGSVEVFLSYQALSLFVSMGIALFGIVAASDNLQRGLALGLAAVLSLWPWNRVAEQARKRNLQIGNALPEFAELLLMPLSTGMSIPQALAFTSQYIDGPVAAEADLLVDTLAKRTLSSTEAFTQAGIRLGTPEALAFFNTLAQAYHKGGEAADALARQADALRKKSYQESRARMKKIPAKLVSVFAVHFLPLLFVLTMVPLVVSLQGV